MGLLLLWTGCAVTITGVASLRESAKESAEVSCGTMLKALAAGIVIDGTIGVSASVTGETFSPVDRLIVGVAALDVVAATVVAIKVCRD